MTIFRYILAFSWCLVIPCLSQSRIRLDDELARYALNRALICLATHEQDGSAKVVGWHGPFYKFNSRDLSDAPAGLHAGVYERKDQGMHMETVLAFRGTKPDQMNDWLTNLANIAGLVPEAYMEGAKAAQVVKAVTRKNGVQQFSITGHSLGGSIASYSALMIGEKATCFGSASVGKGLQQVLWNEASQNASNSANLVVHIFKTDDVVPAITSSLGRHYGAVAEPMLSSPPNYTGIKTPEEKLAYLMVAGMISDKWIKAAGTVAFTYIMEGHGIDQYIAGLTYLITPPGQFSPAGEWVSNGSFFDITSNESRFRICANGRFTLINDFKLMDRFQQQTEDAGEWHYTHPNLHLRIPGFARMTYEMVGGDGERSVMWKRASMEPDLSHLDSIRDEAEKNSALLTAGIVKITLKTMEGKTVLWAREKSEF